MGLTTLLFLGLFTKIQYESYLIFILFWSILFLIPILKIFYIEFTDSIKCSSCVTKFHIKLYFFQLPNLSIITIALRLLLGKEDCFCDLILFGCYIAIGYVI